MDEKLREAIASKVEKVFESRDKEALAELLIEFVQPNHITVDYVGMLLNTRRLNPGDALVKKVRKGIEVRTLVPGAVHLASQITLSERINYVLDGADIKVTYNEWDMDNGNIGTVGSIQSEMRAKLSDFYINKVFTALSTVWSAANTPNNYTDVGSDITAAALEDAINYINQTTRGVRAVVGTRRALTPITKFGAFWNDGGTVGTDAQWAGVNSQLEEVMRSGWLGTYYGAPIVALDQIHDNPEDYNALLPEDKILVIGENVGEFVIFGEPKWKQWSDMNPTPPQWMLEVYQQFGLIIDNAQGIYVLKVTTT